MMQYIQDIPFLQVLKSSPVKNKHKNIIRLNLNETPKLYSNYRLLRSQQV